MSHLKTNKLNVLSTLTLGALFSLSATAAPMSLEGPIQEIINNGDGTGTVTVMNIVVQIPAGILITSPTVSLTMSQLADPTPLPGRAPIAGFLGGTAIISGDSTNGWNVANDVFVEPSENVLMGEVTHSCTSAACDSAGDQLFISGTEMVRIDDARMVANPAINGTGLEIDLSTVAQGGGASAEGYFGADNLFHYFIIEAEGGLVNPAIDEVSIARARCRDGKDMRVLGGVSQSSGTVTVINYGTTPIIPDALTGLGTYSYRLNNINTCPESVTVQFNNATATANTTN